MSSDTNEETICSNGNTHTALNPKLVTKRDGAIIDSMCAASKARSLTTPLLLTPLKPAKLVHAAKPFSAPTSTRCLERPSGQTTPACYSETGSVTNRKLSARRYNHVHSVVKDVIEDRITPLAARHGRPVLRQRSQSLKTGATRPSITHPGDDNDMQKVRKYLTARAQLSSRTSSRTGNDQLNNTSLLLPSSQTLATRDADEVSVSSATRRGRNSGRRPVEWVPTRHLSERAYITVIANSRNSMKVPADFVPRCAREIPERYKYSASMNEESRNVSGRANTSHGSTPRMRTRSLSGIAACQSRRHSFLTPTHSSRMKSKGNMKNVENDKTKDTFPSSSFSLGASVTSARYVNKEKKETPLSLKASRQKPERRNMQVLAKKNLIEPKPLKGLQRVLLFDIEPPKIFA